MTKTVSFHDNRIHSIEFVDEDYETTLLLDIDHIIEWVPSGDTFQFVISPAKLSFQNVSDLEIKLKKPGFTLESYLETILDIESFDVAENRSRFTITLLNENSIKFVAASYILELSGFSKAKYEQYLTVTERKNA